MQEVANRGLTRGSRLSLGFLLTSCQARLVAKESWIETKDLNFFFLRIKVHSKIPRGGKKKNLDLKSECMLGSQSLSLPKVFIKREPGDQRDHSCCISGTCFI